jgi:hypothetical protein
VTKKQYRELRREWNEAVEDGRVLAFGDGSTMKAYPTQRQVLAAKLEALEAGVPIRVVRARLIKGDVQTVAIHGHR